LPFCAFGIAEVETLLKYMRHTLSYLNLGEGGIHMKKGISVTLVISVIALSTIVLSNILVLRSHEAMAGKQIVYKVVETGAKKMGNPAHVQRILNVMAKEGWEYINVVPMTDLLIFKK